MSFKAQVKVERSNHSVHSCPPRSSYGVKYKEAWRARHSVKQVVPKPFDKWLPCPTESLVVPLVLKSYILYRAAAFSQGFYNSPGWFQWLPWEAAAQFGN